MERERMANKMKKMELSHEIEMRNQKMKIKSKGREKYNLRIDELQRNFKKEQNHLLDQFNDIRNTVIKKDYLIKRLINLEAL